MAANHPPCSVPEELIFDILARIGPVKSLLRFKCISRSWYSIISSKVFITAHMRNNNNNSSSLEPATLKAATTGMPQVHSSLCKSLPLLSSLLHHAHYVVGFVNGLYCIRVGHKFGRFVVWNPATRMLRRLPEQYPSPYVKAYGFAFDESSDDYNVVVICKPDTYSHDISSTIVKSFSLRNSGMLSSWKQIECTVKFLTFASSRGVFVKGKLHWVGAGLKIVSFDIKKEVPEYFAGPPADQVYSSTALPSALNLEGSNLCLIHKYLDPGNDDHLSISIDIWVLKEYAQPESWCIIAKLACLHNPQNDTCLLFLPRETDHPITVRCSKFQWPLKTSVLQEDCQIVFSCDGSHLLYDVRSSTALGLTNPCSTCWLRPAVETLVSPTPHHQPG